VILVAAPSCDERRSGSRETTISVYGPQGRTTTVPLNVNEPGDRLLQFSG
jgi:hypothetical protein